MSHPFVYISGSDEFLVDRLARTIFEESAAGLDRSFAVEIIDGQAATIGDVEKAVARFREAVQALGLFGGKRAVWFRSVSFLADSVAGRSERTLGLLEGLRPILAGIPPDEVSVVISACPVDRRRSFAKFLEKEGRSLAADGTGKEARQVLLHLAQEEASAVGLRLTGEAVEALLDRTQGNARLIVQEVRKLATYQQPDDPPMEAENILDLVPSFGEGDLFEPTEAFFNNDLPWTLDALRRHFFTGQSARPLLSTMLNRNRLLIQMRALYDAGEIKFHSGRLETTSVQQAARRHAGHWQGVEDKSSFHLFSQNPWYLSRQAMNVEKWKLPVLLTRQFAFTEAFQEIIDRPHEEETIMRNLAIRLLAGK